MAAKKPSPKLFSSYKSPNSVGSKASAGDNVSVGGFGLNTMSSHKRYEPGEPMMRVPLVKLAALVKTELVLYKLVRSDYKSAKTRLQADLTYLGKCTSRRTACRGNLIRLFSCGFFSFSDRVLQHFEIGEVEAKSTEKDSSGTKTKQSCDHKMIYCEKVRFRWLKTRDC